MADNIQNPHAGRQQILATHPHLKDFLPLLDALNDESRRGSVILSCSFIDSQLRNAIAAFLIEGNATDALLEGYNAPLGTLSSRADAALAMGLISKSEHEEISTLRKIRNIFAHDFRLTFDSPKISDLCKRLKYAAADYNDVIVGSFDQYYTSAVALILSLTNRDFRVGQKRLSPGEWDY